MMMWCNSYFSGDYTPFPWLIDPEKVTVQRLENDHEPSFMEH
jgi:hypothetical protein